MYANNNQVPAPPPTIIGCRLEKGGNGSSIAAVHAIQITAFKNEAARNRLYHHVLSSVNGYRQFLLLLIFLLRLKEVSETAVTKRLAAGPERRFSLELII